MMPRVRVKYYLLLHCSAVTARGATWAGARQDLNVSSLQEDSLDFRFRFRLWTSAQVVFVPALVLFIIFIAGNCDMEAQSNHRRSDQILYSGPAKYASF